MRINLVYRSNEEKAKLRKVWNLGRWFDRLTESQRVWKLRVVTSLKGSYSQVEGFFKNIYIIFLFFIYLSDDRRNSSIERSQGRHSNLTFTHFISKALVRAPLNEDENTFYQGKHMYTAEILCWFQVSDLGPHLSYIRHFLV